MHYVKSVCVCVHIFCLCLCMGRGVLYHFVSLSVLLLYSHNYSAIQMFGIGKIS